MWLTVAVFAVILTLFWRLTGRSKVLPPGPKCYPFIGNIGHFKPLEAIQAHINLRKKYGDIYTIMIFHKPMIIVHGYENIRELLLTHGDIFSDRPKTIINGVFNKEKGLMWSSGELWKEHATFAMTSLRKFGFGKHCLQSQIMEEVDCLMEELGKIENQPIDIKNTLDASVSNVICFFLFGKRFEYNDAKFKRLVIFLERMFVNTNPSSPVFMFPSLHRLPMSSFSHMENSFKEIDAFTKKMIEEHRQNFDENNVNDFIDNFLLEQKKRKDEENSTFTEKLAIVDAVFGLYGVLTIPGNERAFQGDALYCAPCAFFIYKECKEKLFKIRSQTSLICFVLSSSTLDRFMKFYIPMAEDFIRIHSKDMNDESIS